MPSRLNVASKSFALALRGFLRKLTDCFIMLLSAQRFALPAWGNIILIFIRRARPKSGGRRVRKQGNSKGTPIGLNITLPDKATFRKKSTAFILVWWMLTMTVIERVHT